MDGLKEASLFRTQAFLAGEWVDADNGETFDVRNPADGKMLARVPKMREAETRRAIDSARAAWPLWRSKTPKERGLILRHWSDLMLEHADELARILTAEQGKPLAEAKGEIQYAASFLDWFAEEGKRIYGEVIPSPWPQSRVVVLKESVGVCAAITPWNFPAAMITRKVAPALAAGCPIIVKPAEATPLTALAMAELATRAGVPAGVLAVITGDPIAIGKELTGNTTVRKLSFTGSTATGRLLMAQCASSIKKLSLELGGNAPFLVFEDANLDAAVEGAMQSKYRNSGQTCVCANRIYVQESIYEEFAEKLCDAVRKLKVGIGIQAGVTQGPLINESAVRKVESHIADAVANGASILVGGDRHELGGTFFQPTVLGNVRVDMKIAKEEVFGPVAPLFRFSSEEDAIQQANDTEFGLAAYIYTRDLGRVWRVSEGLEYGMVAVNSGILSTEVAPFGGMKQSGLGREGSHLGIDEYLEVKYVLHSGL
ncbi:NAD-dependent succinate-semialdehyde dehydrogenase [Terriglobus sp. ADX1]